MQPKSNLNPGKSEDKAAQTGQNINLSLSDFLPDVFEDDVPSAAIPTRQTPPFAANPGMPAASRSAQPKARSWVDANFQSPPTGEGASSYSPVPNVINPPPVAARLRKQVPILSRISIKPGRWLIFVAVALLIISIGLSISLLYYNNIIGTVPPSNGPLEAYPGANRLDVNLKVSNYVFEVESSLPVLDNAISVPSVTNDTPNQVANYYSHLMSSKGFKAIAPQSYGINSPLQTTLGTMNVFYYVKGKQIARVEIINVSADVDGTQLKKGNTLLILVTAQT